MMFFLLFLLRVVCLLLLLVMVLLSLAVLFFQSPLELMARKMWETSPVKADIAPLYLFFLRMPTFYLRCILTTIIIILFSQPPRQLTINHHQKGKIIRKQAGLQGDQPEQAAGVDPCDYNETNQNQRSKEEDS